MSNGPIGASKDAIIDDYQYDIKKYRKKIKDLEKLVVIADELVQYIETYDFSPTLQSMLLIQKYNELKGNT